MIAAVNAVAFARDMRIGSLEITAALAAVALLAAQTRIRAVAEVGTITPLEMDLDVFERGGGRRSVRLRTPFDIGRDARDGLTLRDAEVSRRHARVSAHDGIAFLEDLHSSNGSFVNERRVRQRAELRPGDVIDVGTTRIAFVAERAL